MHYYVVPNQVQILPHGGSHDLPSILVIPVLEARITEVVGIETLQVRVHCAIPKSKLQKEMPPAGRTWLQALPKIELHAHLSGSIRELTILRFLQDEQKFASSDSSQDAQLLQTINSEIRDFQLGEPFVCSGIFASSSSFRHPPR